jgi:pimeloyl-[acyl-carrier protein] methyl ester esterase
MDGTGELFAPFLKAISRQIDTQVIRYPTDQPLDYGALEALVRNELPPNKPFVLLGESFSGPIAISIASNPPANLVGLLLCCTFASSPIRFAGSTSAFIKHLPIEHVPRSVVGAMLMGRDTTAELRNALDAALALVDARVMRSRALAAATVNSYEKLERISIPALYLRATRDRVIPKRVSDEILHANPRIRQQEIDAPHFLLQTRPEEAAKLIRAFLDELSTDA